MRRKWVYCLLVFIVLCYGINVLLEFSYLSSGFEVTKTIRQSFVQAYSDNGSGHTHLCPKADTNTVSCTTHRPLSTVVIIGALTFIGSRVVADFTARGYKVHALAHIDDMDSDSLFWYRKEQLLQMGVTVEIVDFSNRTQVEKRVLKFFVQNVTIPIVYVPTMVREKTGFNNDRMSTQVEEFVNLLEMARTMSACTEVFLVSDFTSTYGHVTSHDNHMSLQVAWIDAFELMLSTYNSLYCIPMTVIRAHGVYGPWSESALTLYEQADEERHVLNLCWYITDLTHSLHRAITLRTSSCEIFDLGRCKTQEYDMKLEQIEEQFSTEYLQSYDSKYTWAMLSIKREDLYSKSRGIASTLTWAKAFSSAQKPKINVVFTSYFTSEVDAQRNRHNHPNRFAYMSEWYNSIKTLSMNSVIFHDGLQSEFQHKLTQYHSGVTFEYVPSLNQRSTNDARFYAYLNYLENHPEINKVLLTDISDVAFQIDPFELMALLGDWVYVGTDIDIFPNMQAMPWIHERLRNCFGNYSVDYGELHRLMKMETVYNAGVIGGTRTTMMTVLSRIVGYLDSTPVNLNCNMPAVNVAIHKHFFDSVFTGFPLSSRFLRRQVSPKGVYIIHK